MSHASKEPHAFTAERAQPAEKREFTSAAEAAADSPEAEAAYLKDLAEWVEDKDKVYPGQGGTLGWADFRPTVGLARSDRYWDNLTDDAESKRRAEGEEDVNRSGRFKDAPPDYATAVAAGHGIEPESGVKERRQSRAKSVVDKIFRRDHVNEASDSVKES